MSARTAASKKSSTPLRSIGPWGVSAGLHIGIIAIGFLVTWSIIQIDDHLPSPVVTGDVAMMSPIVPLHDVPVEQVDASPTIPMPQMPAAAVETRSVVGPGPVSPVVPASTTPVFAGASMGVAREVVFVIDASGSMTAWLPFVIDEVERTLAAMTADQRFAVVCFSGEAVTVTPTKGLVKATPAASAAAIQSLRTTAGRQPGGGSDPVPAMKEAFSMKPELILLLSEGLAGRGRWAVDRAATMRALDQLNPARDVRVSCIRLTTDSQKDSAVLMEDISAAYGDGDVTTITLEELDR